MTSMTSTRFSEIEDKIGGLPDSIEKQMILELVIEVHRLKHELNDPFYMYACGRISRLSILQRESDIRLLKQKVKQLEDEKS